MKPIVAIPATLLLVYRAYSRQSLTPIGILTAALTATAHAVHPWSVFYALLASFFLAGTAVTKVNHHHKSTLTTTSSGSSSDPSIPHPRTAVQVLCNSLPASLAILAHAYYLSTINAAGKSSCLPRLTGVPGHAILGYDTAEELLRSAAPLLPYAIMAHYASAAADTFSSELGILSSSTPVLITDLLGFLTFSPKRVPRGTNGGVTLAGLAAGLGGAACMAVVAVARLPYCGSWTLGEKLLLGVGVTAVGGLGSVVDSVLGAVLQASVVDARTGKVVEGDGGGKVKILIPAKGNKTGGKVLIGRDLLSNNGVNLLMCSLMSIVGVASAFAVSSILD